LLNPKKKKTEKKPEMLGPEPDETDQQRVEQEKVNKDIAREIEAHKQRKKQVAIGRKGLSSKTKVL
jgi:hypothetical protein